MPNWTVPGTPLREQLRAHAKEATPKAIYTAERSEEIEETFAELQATARRYGDDWVRMTYIGYADRPWLLAHAHDRGVPALDGEDNASFRKRIVNPPGQIIISAILSRAQEIVDAAGVVGTVVGFNLRFNKAYFGSYTYDTHGDGGTFMALGDDVMEFQPTAPFDLVPIIDRDAIIITGTASNDGAFYVRSLNGNAIRYVNPAGVDETIAGGVILLAKFDVDGSAQDGYAKAFISRGYRMGSRKAPHTGVVILPYGCSVEVQASVQALADQAKAFGVTILVERRENP